MRSPWWSAPAAAVPPPAVSLSAVWLLPGRLGCQTRGSGDEWGGGGGGGESSSRTVCQLSVVLWWLYMYIINPAG